MGGFEDFSRHCDTNPHLRLALSGCTDWTTFQGIMQRYCPDLTSEQLQEAWRTYRMLHTMGEHMLQQLLRLGTRGWEVSQYN